MSCEAWRAVSGRGLLSVSGRKRQKKALSSEAIEKAMKGVLNEKMVWAAVVIWGAQTPPRRAIATDMPTPVLRIEVGYSSAVQIRNEDWDAPMKYCARANTNVSLLSLSDGSLWLV